MDGVMRILMILMMILTRQNLNPVAGFVEGTLDEVLGAGIDTDQRRLAFEKCVAEINIKFQSFSKDRTILH